VFKTEVYRAQHCDDGEDASGELICLYSGERCTRISNIMGGKFFAANIHAKRRGYNTFLPETMTQTFQYWRLRYGLILSDAAEMIDAETSMGWRSIPKEVLVR